MTVAAWETFVEKVLDEALNAINSGINLSSATNMEKIHICAFKGIINEKKSRLKAPSASNVRKIFNDTFGFEPWDKISWASGKRRWNSDFIIKRTTAWVDIRHKIAHGAELPSGQNFEFICDSNGNKRLTLKLMKECKRHFEYISNKINYNFSKYLGI